MCRIGRQSHAPPERANTESEKTTRPPAVPHHGIMYDTNKNDCPFRVLPFAKLSRRDKIFTVSVHILSIDFYRLPPGFLRMRLNVFLWK